MRHTFLFEEGVWAAEGTYIDGANNSVKAEGTIKITHIPGSWINDGVLRLFVDKPVTFQNTYEIVPFEEGRDFTSWKSFNPAIGTLIGKIVIVDDSLISVYESEDGIYHGSEYLLRVSDTFYHNRGYAFKENERLSSWVVELTKIA